MGRERNPEERRTGQNINLYINKSRSKIIIQYVSAALVSLVFENLASGPSLAGAPPRFKSWGGPNRAKPGSRARSARDLRGKPESRAKPEKERGEGSR